MRALALISIACLLTGCAAHDVVMRNPLSGEVATCKGSWSDLDPWSQTDACVGGYEASGWVRSADQAP